MAACRGSSPGCVIFSFITEPQLRLARIASTASYVISSFITKPQLWQHAGVAPLVALYPLSSPNHNLVMFISRNLLLRYILFHHQTTTGELVPTVCEGCVISSFITKPQRDLHPYPRSAVALYPLSSPNHNCFVNLHCVADVALYPLSSPNHNMMYVYFKAVGVALYPLSSPNHNSFNKVTLPIGVALYPLSSPNHNSQLKAPKNGKLRYILFHHQTTTRYPSATSPLRCVISSFITKPQLRGLPLKR